jgi:hypothetical protein
MALPASCPAQGFIEHIEPPVAQRGKTTRVTFVGAHLGQAIDLWTTLPAGKVRTIPVDSGDATRAVLDLQVAEDVPVGLCGVRLATRDGLSNMHLFLIDDLPPTARTAPPLPKGGIQGGCPVTLPAAVWGRFRAAEVDRFTFKVEAGQRVSFEVVGNRFGKDVDPLVTLRDAQGKWLAERDNDPGLYFDCRFEHQFTRAGTYTVEVRDARFHGSEHGCYVLRMGRFPAARVALPAVVQPGRRNELVLPEVGGGPIALDVPADHPTGPFMASLRRPGDEGSTWVPLTAASAEVTVARKPCNTLEQATRAQVPGMLCGVLEKPGDREVFLLELQRGQRLLIHGEARTIGSPADLELVIMDATGRELRRFSNPGQDEVIVDFSAPAAGSYGLMVRDLAHDGGPAFVYRLDVRSRQPQVVVNAEVEGLTVPQGGYQALPLAIPRGDRIGALKLRLIGAPPGLTLTPDEIDDKEDGAICKLSASADVPAGLYTLQMVAEPVRTETGVAATLVRTLPLIDRRRVNVDMIPYAPREDQRRLPPALTDRLTVQVTPPAPFTMELPEQLVTLARYQHVDFPIVTTRVPGFDGPITFTARGGQLADKKNGRTRVYAEFRDATPDKLPVMGTIHSRLLSQLARARIDVEGSGVYQGRRVTLIRSFDLDLRSAFRVSTEPAKLSLLPGETARVRVLAERLPSFDRPITVQLAPTPGLDLPATVVIPRGQASVDLDVKVAPDVAPRRLSVRGTGTGIVESFEEELRLTLLDVDIRKPEAPKKK